MFIAKITRSGQVTIPKQLRKTAGIEYGDMLCFTSVPDGILIEKLSVKKDSKRAESIVK